MQTQLPVALILMLIIYMHINQQQNFKHHCSSGPPYPLMALQYVLSLELENWMAPILGLGVFCQWFGLLRFFSYFESFNVSAWMDGEKWELREGGRRTRGRVS